MSNKQNDIILEQQVEAIAEQQQEAADKLLSEFNTLRKYFRQRIELIQSMSDMQYNETVRRYCDDAIKWLDEFEASK